MYDLAIIGAGPGGYHAALIAAEKDLSVVLFEKDNLGGVCLNTGCIPTKTMLHSAKLTKSGEAFSVHGERSLDVSTLQDRKESISATLRKSISRSLKTGGVTLVSGSATITGKGSSFQISCNDTIYEAKNTVLATGSTPIIPPIPGADLSHVMDSTGLLNLETAPEKLLVVGGGVIGLEMASFYNSAGSNVTVVEAQSTIGGYIDSEVEKLLHSSLKKSGITFKVESTVTAISAGAVTIETAKGSEEIEADVVLVSVGRRANSSSLGLEDLGVEMDRGVPVVDGRCQTSIEGLYAIGDLNGKSMLAHTAYREAELVIDTLTCASSEICYDHIPSVIYTSPEVASVGLTEDRAKEKGLPVIIKKRPLGGNGRFLAETSKERGLCKVVLSEDGVVLGVQIVGPYASELINAAAILVQLGITKEQVRSLILPHPTVGEILKELIIEG